MCSSVSSNAGKFAAAGASSPFKMPSLNSDLAGRVSESVAPLSIASAANSKQPFSFAGGNDLSSF